MSMTITEALAEIKTIGKRLEKKRQGILQYVVRDARVKDPLEKDGGSTTFVQQERQGIADLEGRIITIRTAIQEANLATNITVGDQTKTIAEWLTWRREVSTGSRQFLTTLNQSIQAVRAKLQTTTGARLINAASEATAQPGEVVVHVDEKELAGSIEGMEQILGDLDGKLSLLNATTVLANV